MPQMAPINWLSLYFYFLILFLMVIIMNYFLYLNMPKIKMKTNPPLKNNWKW
uniref:ATP synthase complex subunit 8 n=1 Tax=Coccotorus chaoi TaxID=2978103 RepID=A0A977JP02_9CUCU